MPRLLAIAVALMPAGALAGAFMDTTITFVAADDNLFADAAETIPSSPRPDFRPRPGNSLFFDNYDTRNTGEETRTHLVLFREFEPYFRSLTPEAALVLEWDANRSARDLDRFGETGSRTTAGGIREDGSYLAVHLATRPDERFSVVLFPFDSERFRNGFSWDLTWGGRRSFVLATTVPAVRLSYDTPRWYVLAGAKTARTQAFTPDPNETVPECPRGDLACTPTQPRADARADENEAIYGALGGFGVHLGDHLLLEANGGYFQKGDLPTDRAGVLGEGIDELGGSVQVTWFDGMSARRSVDTKLYRSTGDAAMKAIDLKAKPLGYLVSAEFTVVSQNLEDSDALGTVKREAVWAGDVNARMRSGPIDLHLDVVVRSLQFLVRDTPGFFPFGHVSDEQSPTPELFTAIGGAWKLPDAYLVPGLTLGVQFPATALVEGTDPATGEAFEDVTVVRGTKDVRGSSVVERIPLPRNEEARPIYSARIDCKAYLSTLATLVIEAQVSHNENLVSRDTDSGLRTFDNPFVLGLGVLAQARF